MELNVTSCHGTNIDVVHIAFVVILLISILYTSFICLDINKNMFKPSVLVIT